ncbi:relaxase domain-containing protein [Corynebacterium sp. 4HC-13]|nr:relaxase domain-containing protein [Corynebacterium anserum]
MGGKDVTRWFYHAQAPSGVTLGRAPGDRGVPGYDMTFCAPKSVSML